MAGTQIATSVTILNSLLGFQAISLTNFVTSAQSLIALGSKVEIGSAWFNFTSDTTPGAASWTAVGTGNVAYITCLPAGSAGAQTLTVDYSDTAPVWSDSKQGWYLSAGSIMRYVAGVTKTSAAQYDDAFILGNAQWFTQNKFDPQYARRVRQEQHDGTNEGDVYTHLAICCGTINQKVIVNGGIRDVNGAASGETLIISYAARADASTINLYGLNIVSLVNEIWAIGSGGSVTYRVSWAT